MSSADALFAAVYADPEADGPRAVLSDFLLEQADPRGELIALQLQKQQAPLSAFAARREKQLLHANRSKWLGPLTKLLVGEEKWDRGFLSEAWVKLPGDAQCDARWNTVKKVRLYVAGNVLPRELGSGNFRALSTLHGAFRPGLEVLLAARARPPLQELELLGPGSQSAWNKQQISTLLEMTAYPGLTRLKLKPALWPWKGTDLQWLWGSALAQQLHALELDLTLPLDVAGCLGAAEQLPQLQRLVIGHAFFFFELTRGADGRLSALHLHFSAVTQNASYLPQLAPLLRALPDDALTHFVFTTEGRRFPPAKLKPLRSAVARQRLLVDERW